MSYVRTEAQRQACRKVQAVTAATQKAERAQWVEDVADMIDSGAGIYEIADRLGYRNVDSLLRRLMRAGRHDLSRRLSGQKRVA